MFGMDNEVCGFGMKSCALCARKSCLAGMNEDDFILASEEDLISRVRSRIYPDERDRIIRALRRYYDYEYVE